MTTSAGQEGFSIVEALAALAILAIATIGLVRAAEAHVDSIRALELRAAAQWVAENRLAELGLPGRPELTDEVEMLGHRWQVAVRTLATDDPDLHRVRIQVWRQGNEAPLMKLDGFVDAGTTTP